MKKTKKRNQLNISYTQKTVPVSLIDTSSDETAWDKKELKSRAIQIVVLRAKKGPKGAAKDSLVSR